MEATVALEAARITGTWLYRFLRSLSSKLTSVAVRPFGGHYNLLGPQNELRVNIKQICIALPLSFAILKGKCPLVHSYMQIREHFNISRRAVHAVKLARISGETRGLGAAAGKSFLFLPACLPRTFLV